MKRLLLAATLAAGAMIATIAPASARDGCGPGFHAGPRGRCLPNRGPGFRPGYRHGPGPIVGNYYHGRGYYHGGRYWRQRYRHNHDWRYR